jgi:hypothetical protein
MWYQIKTLTIQLWQLLWLRANIWAHVVSNQNTDHPTLAIMWLRGTNIWANEVSNQNTDYPTLAIMWLRGANIWAHVVSNTTAPEHIPRDCTPPNTVSPACHILCQHQDCSWLTHYAAKEHLHLVILITNIKDSSTKTGMTIKILLCQSVLIITSFS